jgi:hypothetical protein
VTVFGAFPWIFPVESVPGWRRRWIVETTTFSWLKWIFPICHQNFWHLAIGSLWKSLFNLGPGLIAIEPLDFSAIYKIIISFQFNQFNLLLTLQLLILLKLPLEKSINHPIESLSIHFDSRTPNQLQTLVFFSIKLLIALIN